MDISSTGPAIDGGPDRDEMMGIKEQYWEPGKEKLKIAEVGRCCIWYNELGHHGGAVRPHHGPVKWSSRLIPSMPSELLANEFCLLAQGRGFPGWETLIFYGLRTLS